MALILVIELSGKGTPWLAYVAAVYVLGRVAHAMGMDAEAVSRLRMIGELPGLLLVLIVALVYLKPF